MNPSDIQKMSIDELLDIGNRSKEFQDAFVEAASRDNAAGGQDMDAKIKDMRIGEVGYSVWWAIDKVYYDWLKPGIIQKLFYPNYDYYLHLGHSVVSRPAFNFKVRIKRTGEGYYVDLRHIKNNKIDIAVLHQEKPKDLDYYTKFGGKKIKILGTKRIGPLMESIGW